MFDAQDDNPDLSILPDGLENTPLFIIKNKIDLVNSDSTNANFDKYELVSISAKDGTGIDILTNKLSNFAGLNNVGEGVYLARQRHINALELALDAIDNSIEQLDSGSAELMAEDLRQAGQYMGSITGEFSSDDLLGEIFSSFCIGK